ncbi:MAG TPA: phosphatase PAP2 family protein [Candidatus Dormibacteraeota bacterium]
MSATVAAIPTHRATTSPFRRPFLVVGLVLLAIFAGLTFYAAGNPYMPFDVSLERSIQAVDWGPLVTVFNWFDWLEGTRQLYAGIGAIVLVAVINWRKAPLIAVGAAAGPIYSIIQGIIQRPRPSADLVHVIRHTGSFSFPSGHVVFFSWVLVLLVVCLAVGRLPRPLVAVVWIAVAVVLLVDCIGRIYLGEHWPSDVFGGLALGLGWTSLALSVRLLSNPALARRK